MILYLFLSLYFSTNSNIEQFKVTNCNNSEYILIKNESNLELIKGGEKVEYPFKESSKYFLLDFYCYNNKLFFLEIEKKILDGIELFRHLVIYEIKESSLEEKEWISTPDEYYNINNHFKEFSVHDNKLFFYNYQNYQIYKIDYWDSFYDNILYRDYFSGTVRQLIENNNMVAIDFKKDNSSRSEIYLLGYDTEKIIDNGFLRDFINKGDKNIIAYYKEDNKLIIDINNNKIKTDISLFDDDSIKLFYLEDIIYFFIKKDGLTLNIIFLNDNNRIITKELNDNLIDLDKIDNNIYYLRDNSSEKEIYLIKEAVDLIIPEVFLKGALKENPTYLEYSNLNEDSTYFTNTEIEIANDENFNNILLSKRVDTYNESYNKQFYDISNLISWQKDKLYYVRVRYKDIFERYSLWGKSNFIIYDLGKLKSFEIKNSSGEKNFTKDRIVTLFFEKLDRVENIEISTDSNFTTSSLLEYKDSMEYLLEDRDGVHNLYARAIVKNNNKVISYTDTLSASITLNRTNIKTPTLIFPLDGETVREMPLTIKWNYNEDLNYDLIIAKDISFNEVVKEYYFINSGEQKIPYITEGEYFLKIYAKDKSDNKSLESITHFYIENKKSSTGCQF